MSQLLAVSFSQVFGVQFWINVGLLAAIYGLFTAGMQLNIGTTGLYNFAQAGFMAVGAYTMGILVVDAHLSFWAALPLAAASAVAVALIVGVPSLRLRGDYFAIATIAASETIQYIIQNIGITGGNQGLLGFNGQWTTLSTSISSLLDLSSSGFLVPLLIVSWVIFILALVALSVLQRTPWGRVLKAIRDDQDAARSLGKSIFRYKLQSLSIAAVLGAIAGYLLALDLAYLSPNEFTTDNTFIAAAMLLVGGLGSYRGVLIGAVLIETLLNATLSLNLVGLPLSDSQLGALRFVLIGALLVGLALWRPQGLLGRREAKGP
jgi:branched-chain amino acid transport system permease protein